MGILIFIKSILFRFSQFYMHSFVWLLVFVYLLLYNWEFSFSCVFRGRALQYQRCKMGIGSQLWEFWKTTPQTSIALCSNNNT